MAKKEKPTRESVRAKAEGIEKKLKPHIVLGEMVLERLKPIYFIGPEEMWRWSKDDGLWHITEKRHNINFELNNIIEQCGKEMPGYKATSSIVEETRKWILRQPEHNREAVQWDVHHRKVALRSGLYDIDDKTIREYTPEDHATHAAPVRYDAKARCPLWLQFLGDMFDEKTIFMLQEAIGLTLFQGSKSKELSRALLFHGASDSGKTQIINVITKLISDQCITTPLAMLDSAHGTSDFWRNLPWVLNEAFDQGKWHFSSIVKLILEGETININRKNRDMISMRYTAPVIWGTNVPPQFKEATKAIVNRLLIVNCKKTFDARNLTGVAKIAFDKGYQYPWQLLVKEEGPGILNWALEGMHRALKRGRIEFTEEAYEALEAVYQESNLAALWLNDGYISYDTTVKNSPADVYSAFMMFWVQHRGMQNHPSQQTFIGMLKQINAGFRFGEKELRTKKHRYIGSLRLNEEAIEHWHQSKSVPQIVVANVSAEKSELNPPLKSPEPKPRKASVRTSVTAAGDSTKKR
jgi:phage/plasmid-associated DNA primase